MWWQERTTPSQGCAPVMALGAAACQLAKVSAAHICPQPHAAVDSHLLSSITVRLYRNNLGVWVYWHIQFNEHPGVVRLASQVILVFLCSHICVDCTQLNIREAASYLGGAAMKQLAHSKNLISVWALSGQWSGYCQLHIGLTVRVTGLSLHVMLPHLLPAGINVTPPNECAHTTTLLHSIKSLILLW